MAINTTAVAGVTLPSITTAGSMVSAAGVTTTGVTHHIRQLIIWVDAIVAT